MEPFLVGSAVGTEYRFVFSCKGISEAVLKDAARAHDNRILAIIVQQTTELLTLGIRKFPRSEALGKGVCKAEIFLFTPLPDADIPEIIVHDIGIKDIRTDVVGIVGFQPRIQIRTFVFDDFPCQQHTASLSANHSGADHAAAHLKIVFRGKAGHNSFCPFIEYK